MFVSVIVSGSGMLVCLVLGKRARRSVRSGSSALVIRSKPR
ncbi:hypothetical protein [Nonomuraea sp. GTA35]